MTANVFYEVCKCLLLMVQVSFINYVVGWYFLNHYSERYNIASTSIKASFGSAAT